ncbi:MAG: hypothetical protein GXP38_14225 [Chloroflexi bacterium]|nr:hypothetical protein [Chloroflexota bacterium]
MNLAYLIDIFRRRWWIVASIILLALLSHGFALKRSQQTLSYTSKAGLFILPTDIRVKLEPQLTTVDSGLPRDNNAKSDRRQALLALVKSPVIAEAVFNRLRDQLSSEISNPGALLSRIKGSVGGEVLLIHATFGESRLAAEVANAWAVAYEAKANAIFGNTVTPDNLDVEVENARVAYEAAQDHYVLFLADSPLLELQRRLDDRNALLDQILADRLNNLDVVRRRMAELDRLLLDARSLNGRLQGMGKPDVSVYLAYLLLQNAALVQEDMIVVDGPPGAEVKLISNNLLDTSLILEPNQIVSLMQDISITDMTEQLDAVIASIEEKRVALGQILAPPEAAQDGGALHDARIVQMESEVRMLQSQVEAETEQEKRLQMELDTAQGTYKVLLNKLEEVRITNTIGEGSIVRFAFPATPESQNHNAEGSLSLAGLVIAAIIGLLTALGVVVLLEFIDDTLRTSEQVEHVLGVLPLATLPRSAPTMQGIPVILNAPITPFAEGVRYLRIRLRSLHPTMSTLLITSALPQDGKSSVAGNLAIAFAVGGQRVVLVDANLRAPVLHQLFGLPNRVGLSSWLEGECDSVDACLHDTSVPHLKVLTAGPSTERYKICRTA